MSSTTLSTVRTTTVNHAARLVRKVTSCYPSANPIALKEYWAELATLLSKYPEGVAAAAIDRAMAANPNFPPPVPLVKNHADELVTSSRQAFDYAKAWEAQSQQQLRERAERDAAEEPLEHRRAAVERMLAEYRSQLTPEATKPQRQSWRKFSDDDLRAMYPKREATP
jgi:hypothetical protein